MQATQKKQEKKYKYSQFEIQIAAMLTKAELIFDLSKVLEDCYYYPEEYEADEKETFTINLKQSDGSVIARCLRKYNKSHSHKYYWQPVEVAENQKMEQTSDKEQHQTKNTCPPGVVNVLVKTAIFFDLAKLLQSELSIVKPESYMFEVEYDNKMMGVSGVYCPCFPGVTWCCG